MVCLAEDLHACITTGDLNVALDRLGDLMRSDHRPSPKWEAKMLAAVFEESVKQGLIQPARRVLARTADSEILQTRIEWLRDQFPDEFQEERD